AGAQGCGAIPSVMPGGGELHNLEIPPARRSEESAGARGKVPGKNPILTHRFSISSHARPLLLPLHLVTSSLGELSRLRQHIQPALDFPAGVRSLRISVRWHGSFTTLYVD